MELNLELKLKLTTTSPVGGWVLSQLKLKLYFKLELSLAIGANKLENLSFLPPVKQKGS